MIDRQKTQKEYGTRDGYVGRVIYLEPRAFTNMVLNVLLFESEDAYLSKYGIKIAAQANWKKALLEGEIPTVDKNGDEFHWGSFIAFERHVQTIYDRLSKGTKTNLMRKVTRS